MIIDLEGLGVEVIKKNVKHLNLRIYPPDGAIKVSVPLHYTERMIYSLLHEKKDWLFHHSKRLRVQSSSTHTPLTDGQQFRLLGKNYRLHFKRHEGPNHCYMDDAQITVYTSNNYSEAQRLKLVQNWLKKKLETLIPPLLEHWQKIINVQVTYWGIRAMKTRWGSCNTRSARIWFNLSLVHKEPICLEYVLVHELVHLLEPSHNKRFYQLMTQFMPKWREYDDLLEGRSSC